MSLTAPGRLSPGHRAKTYFLRLAPERLFPSTVVEGQAAGSPSFLTAFLAAVASLLAVTFLGDYRRRLQDRKCACRPFSPEIGVVPETGIVHRYINSRGQR